MSSQSSSRYPSTSHPRKRIYTPKSYKNSAQTHYTPYEPRMALSSSPPHSSSPPTTPYSTRHARSDAFVRTSPEIVSDTLFHSVREYMEDPSFTCGPRYSSNGYPERAYTPVKQNCFSTHAYPPPSDFDFSEFSEDVDYDIPEVDSEYTNGSVPGRNSVFFSDSEEEENHGDDELRFGHSGYRTIFFRTSAERGQWKSHPLPFKSTPLPPARRSASITLRLPTPDSTRTNSEPAPSTGFGLSVKPDQCDNLSGADSSLPISSFRSIAESEVRPEAESPHTMPSLTSDWESIPDIDLDGQGCERRSSPLPPSSPMSYSVSILSRSVSPATSPVMRSSSPLSEISLDQEDSHADEVEGTNTDFFDIEVEIRSSSPASIFVLDADVKSGNFDDVLATTINTTPSFESDVALSVDATVIPDFQVLNGSSSNSAATAPNPDHEHSSSIDGNEVVSKTTEAVRLAPDSSAVNLPTDSMDDQSQHSGLTHAGGGKSTQEIQEHDSTQVKVEDYNKRHVVRRKRRKGNDDDDKHPILKKRKVDTKAGRGVDLLRSTTCNSVRNEKAEKHEKNPSKSKRCKNGEIEVSISCPASSTKRSKPHRLPLPKASSHSQMTSVGKNDDDHQPVPLHITQDPETTALNAEICGMLIETMALSRASSLPLSSLYKMVMQTQPSLSEQRSESEWLAVFARVLHEGEAGTGSGVFGKVESSGKDNSNRPLEAQWFYVPEQDEDQERAALIRSMMPRPAKRTETKKYKQYYWRPLDKISKWDPEDEL